MTSHSPFSKMHGPHGWRAHKALGPMKMPVILPIKVKMGQREINKAIMTNRNRRVKVTLPKMPWDKE